MEKNINVMDFVDGFKKAEDKDAYVDSMIIIRDYVPFAEKIALCNSVIGASHIKNGKPDMDTVKRGYLFILMILNTYTNFEEITESTDYDSLMSAGAMEYILSRISEGELSVMSNTLEQQEFDFYNKYCSTQAVIKSELNILKKLALGFLDGILQNSENFSPEEAIKKVIDLEGEVNE